MDSSEGPHNPNGHRGFGRISGGGSGGGETQEVGSGGEERGDLSEGTWTRRLLAAVERSEFSCFLSEKDVVAPDHWYIRDDLDKASAYRLAAGF